jgi:hypothetical protein
VVEIPEENLWSWHEKKKEKDIIDQLLDNIDFHRLTQDEVVGQDGLIKQLTGKILHLALEAKMTEEEDYSPTPQRVF